MQFESIGSFSSAGNHMSGGDGVPVLNTTAHVDGATHKAVNKNYSKYKKLESKTGVPWKAVAAIDLATNYPLGMVTKKVQKFAVSKGLTLTPESDVQDVVGVVNLLKKESPSKTQLLDSFLSHYISIEGAYD